MRHVTGNLENPEVNRSDLAPSASQGSLAGSNPVVPFCVCVIELPMVFGTTTKTIVAFPSYFWDHVDMDSPIELRWMRENSEGFIWEEWHEPKPRNICRGIGMAINHPEGIMRLQMRYRQRRVQ